MWHFQDQDHITYRHRRPEKWANRNIWRKTCHFGHGLDKIWSQRGRMEIQEWRMTRKVAAGIIRPLFFYLSTDQNVSLLYTICVLSHLVTKLKRLDSDHSRFHTKHTILIRAVDALTPIQNKYILVPRPKHKILISLAQFTGLHQTTIVSLWQRLVG